MAEMRGKSGHKVPVLLTPEMKTAIDMLKRKEVEINLQTHFFFFARASENSTLHLRAGTP